MSTHRQAALIMLFHLYLAVITALGKAARRLSCSEGVCVLSVGHHTSSTHHVYSEGLDGKANPSMLKEQCEHTLIIQLGLLFSILN